MAATTGCAITGGEPTSRPGEGPEATLVSVADGDTIEIDIAGDMRTVRLAGINAPEADECHAATATGHLREREGSTVTLAIVGEDQFGRDLAHVFFGGTHLNLEMVEMGHAIATTPDPGDPHGTNLTDAEATAHQDGAGLWGVQACGSDGSMPEATIDAGLSQVDPPGPDEEVLDSEKVVVVNRGVEHLDLSGWLLRDESSRHRFRFAAGTELAPGDAITVSSADPGWSPGGSPVWNNGGDLALLQDPDGTVVSRWRY